MPEYVHIQQAKTPGLKTGLYRGSVKGIGFTLKGRKCANAYKSGNCFDKRVDLSIPVTRMCVCVYIQTSVGCWEMM